MMSLRSTIDPTMTMNRYFATVARGLEELALQELSELGAKDAEIGFCGVSFQGDRELLYRVNLWARLPFRILVKLGDFPSGDDRELYQSVQAIDWSQYLDPRLTMAVTVTGKNDTLNHSHLTAVQIKRAITNQQMANFGDRSNVDTDAPDIRINVHIDDDTCTVSLDSSGNSLHRRGYRAAVGNAPLKESLAAALVKLSGWTPDLAFYDPLCGSGTLPLEAAMQAVNLAPGLFRESFGFERWLDFDRALFDKLLQEAEGAERKDLALKISGSDRDEDVLRQAQSNAHRSGIDRYVDLQVAELAEVEAPAATGILLCNPPYGERLGRDRDLGAFYKLLGDVLKQRFKGWNAYVLSGNKELAKSIGLRSAQRIPVYNGNILCQLMKYEMY
jgi:putative N6-adenine-specific DNA methylase